MKSNTIYIILLLSVFLNPLKGQGTIGLSTPDTTINEGDTILLPFNVDSTLTGKNFYSFMIELDYNPSYFTIYDIEDGDFGPITYSFRPSNKIRIAGASTSPYSGTGTLFNIKSTISYPYIYLSSASYFNEDFSDLTFNVGSFNIIPKPVIDITPDRAELLVGDSLQFTAFGDTIGPFSYSLSAPDKGTIDGNGLFVASSPGTTKVTVEDANGAIATTHYEIDIYGFKLSAANGLSEWQGDTVLVPLFTTNLSSLNITSGQFDVNYNHNALSFVSTVNSNTLLSDANISSNVISDGKVRIAFASSPINQAADDFILLKFAVSKSVGYGSSISISDILFNESIVGISENGYFTPKVLPNLIVSPNSASMYAGDSLQLNVSNGILPYTFTSSAPSILSVSSSGMLYALSGGDAQINIIDSVGATKTTSFFDVIDTYVEIPDTTGPVNAYYNLPVIIGNLQAGVSVSSLQTSLTIDTSYLEFMSIETSNTLSDNWSFTQYQNNNTLNIAGAATMPLSDSGTLFHLRFRLKDKLTINARTYVTILDFMLNEGNPSTTFRSGSIKGTKSEDLGISEIVSPVSGCSHTASEAITVMVSNMGYVDYPIGHKLPVSFRFNNGTEQVDTITLNSVLASGSMLSYTFNDSVNMATPGNYTISAKTLLESTYDGNPSNDNKQVSVSSSGIVSIDLGDSITSCQGDSVLVEAPSGLTSYLWSNGSTEPSILISSSGKYWLTVTNELGCETSDTIIATFIPLAEKPSIVASDFSMCVGDTIMLSASSEYASYLWSNGETDSSILVSEAGEYTLMVSNGGECYITSDTITITEYNRPVADFSIVTYGLSIEITNNSQNSTNYSWEFGDSQLSGLENPTHIYSALDTFTITLIAYNSNCSDTTSLLLPRELFITNEVEQHLCSGEVISFGSQLISESGSYYESFTDSNGKDSLVHLIVAQEAPLYAYDSITVYKNQLPYNYNGMELGADFTSGDTTFIYTSINGCDSTVFLNVDVYNKTSVFTYISDTICSGSELQFGDSTLNTQGEYTMTYMVSELLDSIVILDLMVLAPVFSYDSIAINKDQLPYDYNGIILGSEITTGEIPLVFTSINGCDSTVYLEVEVYTKTLVHTYINDTICSGSEFQFGDSTLHSQGEYTETFMISDRLDSIVVLNLVVLAPIESQDSIVINESDLPYDYNGTILGINTVSSDTTLYYVSSMGCDSTVNLKITIVPTSSSLNKTIVKESVIYPNPTSDFIKFKAIEADAKFQLIDLQGRIVLNQDINEHSEIPVSTLAKGLYIYSISTNNKREQGELIIK